MRMLGVDVQFADAYENMGTVYRHITPAPMICEAILDPLLPAQFSFDLLMAKCVFREDDYNLTSRLRRGRFYLSSGSQPSRCGVVPRTVEEYERNPRPRDMFTFVQYQLTGQSKLPKLAALGSTDLLWRVIGVPERISTGELLFTLKARHAFGILPEINQQALPEREKEKVNETLDKLVDAANRELPEAIIDRARDATQWCLATWAASEFGNAELLQEDLGRLLSVIGAKRKMVALSAAQIIQRLHSRVKPNEQERYQVRPPMEADAELALNSVGFLIRELGWAAT